MTDGIADCLGGGGLAADTMRGWWATPPQPVEFAAQVDFASAGFDDDRTLIGIWPSWIDQTNKGHTHG